MFQSGINVSRSFYLFVVDETQVCREQNEQQSITRKDISTVLHYVQTWPSRYDV